MDNDLLEYLEALLTDEPLDQTFCQQCLFRNAACTSCCHDGSRSHFQLERLLTSSEHSDLSSDYSPLIMQPPTKEFQLSASSLSTTSRNDSTNIINEESKNHTTSSLIVSSSRKKKGMENAKVYPVHTFVPTDESVSSRSSTSSTESTQLPRIKRTDHLFKSRYRDLETTLVTNQHASSLTLLSSSSSSSSSYSTIPPTVPPNKENIKSLSSFIDKLVEYSNLADATMLTKLIKACMNDYARICVSSPVVKLDKIGSMIVIGMTTSMSKTFPDGHLRVTYIKRYRDGSGMRKIKAKLRYSATKTNDELIPEVSTNTNSSDGKFMASDSIDKSVSSQVIDEVRRREEDHRRDGLMSSSKVEYKVTINMSVDDFTDKIAVYDVESRLVSFAGMSLHEISDIVT